MCTAQRFLGILAHRTFTAEYVFQQTSARMQHKQIPVINWMPQISCESGRF